MSGVLVGEQGELDVGSPVVLLVDPHSEVAAHQIKTVLRQANEKATRLHLRHSGDVDTGCCDVGRIDNKARHGIDHLNGINSLGRCCWGRLLGVREAHDPLIITLLLVLADTVDLCTVVLR